MDISKKENKTFTDTFSLIFQRILDVCKGLLFGIRIILVEKGDMMKLLEKML